MSKTYMNKRLHTRHTVVGKAYHTQGTITEKSLFLISSHLNSRIWERQTGKLDLYAKKRQIRIVTQCCMQHEEEPCSDFFWGQGSLRTSACTGLLYLVSGSVLLCIVSYWLHWLISLTWNNFTFPHSWQWGRINIFISVPIPSVLILPSMNLLPDLFKMQVFAYEPTHLYLLMRRKANWE